MSSFDKVISNQRDNRLLELFKEHAILHGEFTLASGLKSTYYFDGRLITLWPEGACLIGNKFFEILSAAGVEAVGGMTMGADPIVSSVAVASYLAGRPMPAFIVRAEVKGHGTQKRIEGPLRKGARVGIVDDVLTTGGSVIKSIAAVEEFGCTVGKVVVLLDRNQGGAEELRKRGYDLTAVLSADTAGVVRLA